VAASGAASCKPLERSPSGQWCAATACNRLGEAINLALEGPRVATWRFVPTRSVRNLRARSFLTVYIGCNLCRPQATYVNVGRRERGSGSGGRLKMQLVHVEDARQSIAQSLVYLDHEVVVYVVPGLDDLQLRFDLGQPAHHVDLEQ